MESMVDRWEPLRPVRDFPYALKVRGASRIVLFTPDQESARIAVE
jgi:hypothetical protein